MLKLNSSKAFIFGIVVASLFNCTGQKSNVREQNKFADTLSVKTNGKQSNAITDSSQPNFNISIEGYKATQLGQVAYKGDTVSVKALVSKGASIENCLTDDIYVYDILFTALEFNRIELVHYVLKNKLYKSINAIYTENAATPLTLACNLPDSNDALEIADSLIKLGANTNGVNVSNGDGSFNTTYPLLSAVSNNNVRLTKLLIDHGAKKEIKNSAGETLITIAEKKGFIDLVNLLKGN